MITQTRSALPLLAKQSTFKLVLQSPSRYPRYRPVVMPQLNYHTLHTAVEELADPFNVLDGEDDGVPSSLLLM